MKEYIKEYILSNIEDMAGRTVYMCDLSSYLYESDNMTGSITCNRAEAEEFLTEHKAEFVNVLKYWKFHAGDEFSNNIAIDYFENPEKAHCILVFAYVDAVLNLYLGQRDDWNEEKEITPEFIEEIKNNIDSMIDAGFADMDSYGND